MSNEMINSRKRVVVYLDGIGCNKFFTFFSLNSFFLSIKVSLETEALIKSSATLCHILPAV